MAVRRPGCTVAPPRCERVPGLLGWLSARLVGVEIDPHGEEVGAHGADGGSVDTPADSALALARVVLGQHLPAARAPPAADVDAHVRVCLDVSHIGCASPVLGDDPEGVTLQSVSHRRSATLAGPASG